MKHRVIAFLALVFLASCVPLPMESAVDACPATGLVDTVFTEGRPPGGDIIPSEPGKKEGALVWHLSGKDTYLTCYYDDATTRLQKLPSGVTSCKRTKGGLLSCLSYI
jgi:hypothetical protein